jgi:outer membrane protein OmpA-like peptidoglycan-associated protein
LKKIATGNILVLNNIFFQTDHYTLEPESYPELDILAGFLAKNQGLTVEISGHTDNVGSDEYNMQLSAKRAGAVYDYLVGKGIDPRRLSFKGYGESKPVASNEEESGRAKNRRTEMKILESN